MKKIIIAIDGYSACGKSTLAKQLAEKLDYIFLDTGAMYRAVTLFLLRNTIDWNNAELLKHALMNIQIDFKKTATAYSTYLNNENVEEEIRNMHVANKVSEVAAVSAVRKFLVKQQQEIGKQKGIVLDGRDIGTVVFPNAEVKLFITASMEVRVVRRYKELSKKDIQITHEIIRKNLMKRDLEETTRTDSPLIQHPDAIVIDTSYLTPEQQLKSAFNIVKNYLIKI
ncbi:MAG TPA: (d)CMP kinase [Chitinophagales bacterium]|nr:(d)CMP kinase [Chitinophagales bacterium]